MYSSVSREGRREASSRFRISLLSQWSLPSQAPFQKCILGSFPQSSFEGKTSLISESGSVGCER